MASDFTVILDKPVHVGNESNAFSRPLEHTVSYHDPVPYAFEGPAFGLLEFNCDDVKRDEIAVLMFDSRDVSYPFNEIQINGLIQKIPVGTGNTLGGNREWSGNILLVGKNILLAKGNKFGLKSFDEDGKSRKNIDDFVINNVVIFYKLAAKT